jgi:hypothetical protein
MRRRLEEEERDFLERRREYVKSIIQFEKQVRKSRSTFCVCADGFQGLSTAIPLPIGTNNY